MYRCNLLKIMEREVIKDNLVSLKLLQIELIIHDHSGYLLYLSMLERLID